MTGTSGTAPLADAELVARVRQRIATGRADVTTALRAETVATLATTGSTAATTGAVAGIVDDTVFDRLRRDVQAELHGTGPLEPLLATPGVTDVMVNGPDSVWLDRGHGMERAPVSFPDAAAVRALAQRLAASAGRRLDDAMPYVDAVLADGTRLHAILPPLVAATTISLRVLARRRFGLADLVDAGSVPTAVAGVLREIVAARLAVVIAGGTGTGKTTLLGALLAEVPADERLVLVEDAPELVVDHPHVVRLLTRPANVEGAGAVVLRDLVRQALRMRPDRLVVGEFRGVETVDLLVALNTGHEGGAATLHANSAGDVPARFAALGALAGLTVPAVTSLVGSAVDVVIHLRRGRDGMRRVDEIALLDRVDGVDGGDGTLAVTSAWTSAAGEGPAAGRLARLLAERRSA